MVISGARALRARESFGRDGSRAPAAAKLECRTFTDDVGIPHVRAKDEKTAFACLGYVHGLERPWHMDYLRRTVQGRAAEVLGYPKVRPDFLMRILGIYPRAQDLASRMDPVLRERVELYSAGVNRGMAEALKRLETSDRRGVYEFADFGYRPEPWRPEDSVAVLMLMSFDQTRRTFEDKLAEVERASRFGEEARALYSDDGLPWDTAILKPGEYRRAAPAPADTRKTPRSASLSPLDFPTLKDELGLGSSTETGSNNWVIAPSRSKSGNAWLANDPHLDAKRPAFWHWIHLSSDDGIDVVGATVPGVPIFASGANRDVTWGLTNAYVDVTELAYVREENLRRLSTERPWVWFRWGMVKIPVFFKTFSRTEEGYPILPLSSPEGTKLVLRWSGFRLGPSDMAAFVDLMKARDARELDAILARTGIPSFNYVFADRKGDIGFRVIGHSPAMAHELPYAVPELASFHPWAFRTAEQMPSVFNPKRGYVATANNRQWPSDAAEVAGRFHRRALRAFRIEERILATPKHDFDSIREIQCDSQAPEARWVLPALLSALPKELSAEETRAIKELESWGRDGYRMSLECRACGIYRAWLARIYEKEQLEIGSLYRMLTEASARRLAPGSLAQTIREGFAAAVSRVGTKSWAELHRAPFPHLAGASYRPIDAIGTPGDDFSVNLGTGKWNGEGFDHVSAPSMRMIVEMTRSGPKMAWMLAGSNRDLEAPVLGEASGPWSRWGRCEYTSVRFPVDWEKVPAEIVRF